ncbi:MAG: glycosyltransferase [Bacteroidales bacterium]|nr:glycosyltransferase [Bacteroidales bacterium]
MKTEKKKILFLIESLSGGGAEKVLTTLLKFLDKEKFCVVLCSVADCGVYVQECKKYVDYYAPIIKRSDTFLGKIKYKIIYDWIPTSWIYKMYIPQECDIEVSFCEGFATKILSYSTNKKSKKIAWVHTDLESNHWTKKVYRNDKQEETAYNNYDQIISVSERVKESLEKIYRLHVPVKTLYNPIDLDDIVNKSKEIVDDVEIKEGVLRMVTVGRLERQKGYVRLLNIINRLIREGINNINLWIVGEGSERDCLEALIDKNNLHDYIKLLGFKSNPYKYIAMGDIFVCSSIAEGYSTAVTEALILGIPVVTTDCSGMDELLCVDKCGLITDNSEQDLYDGLKAVILDPSVLLNYRNNIEIRKKDFNTGKLVSEIERYFL